MPSGRRSGKAGRVTQRRWTPSQRSQHELAQGADVAPRSRRRRADVQPSPREGDDGWATTARTMPAHAERWVTTPNDGAGRPDADDIIERATRSPRQGGGARLRSRRGGFDRAWELPTRRSGRIMAAPSRPQRRIERVVLACTCERTRLSARPLAESGAVRRTTSRELLGAAWWPAQCGGAACRRA